ncbi:nucleoside hydrolase [Halomarina salina]|uniref:Nucleoside hydrolase n=1 Tax=Halomarina salina TaxID=1872699 RepID=A0ABD5RTE0_9EURY|nr:nucleoside hydrolase [Halomarina salina]
MSQKVLLDVDPGCDDAVMLAMALAAPDIDVVGLTTVAGNTTVDNTTRNALAILELLDAADVPVARGAGQPIVGELDTAEEIHGPNGIRGDLPDPSTEPVDQHAVDFTIDRARELGDDLTILAVGPMTNLATALVKEPDLPSLVDDIYLMGGSASGIGNKTATAEANFHNDAVAAKRVVRSARPRMVGLDATNRATVPLDDLDELLSSPPPLDAFGAWLDYPEEVRQFGEGSDPAVHDAAVVAHVLDDVLAFEPAHLDVEVGEGPFHGAVACDRRDEVGKEPNAEVAVDIDVEGFRALVDRTIERLRG